MVQEIMSKMQYKGESHNWDWNWHCAKFHLQLVIINAWAIAGLDTHMSNKDQIGAFLKTIPKDCKNGDLLIAKGIIEGGPSWFPTLVGNVIPMLTPNIKTKEHSAQVPKCMIANAVTHPKSHISSGKHR